MATMVYEGRHERRRRSARTELQRLGVQVASGAISPFAWGTVVVTASQEGLQQQFAPPSLENLAPTCLTS